jgi:formylglycine-generating enzyme required for sulfatase activity
MLRPFLSALLFAVIFTTSTSFANNISVTNVTVTNQDVSDDYVIVQFDLSWDNSWRDGINWDAAWVFLKYQVSGDVWKHATLGTFGHTAPSGCSIDAVTDGKGVFIHRSEDGTGTFSPMGIRLRWEYGLDGMNDGANVTIDVLAVEMVYIPSGEFAAGDGGSGRGRFTLTTINTSDATVAPSGTGSLGGQAGGYPTGQTAPSNNSWPNGYNSFYCMKYEVSQEQFVAFLNTLTYDQQVSRTAEAPNSVAGTRAMTTVTNRRSGIKIQSPGISSSTPAVYACDLSEDGTYDQYNDGQNVACNFLTWMDGTAYADWAALRPLTELEFEKACRGAGQIPVINELVWGTLNCVAVTTFINSGQSDEASGTSGANCNNGYVPYTPIRVGAFATSSSNREESGAGYYGNMELGGNMYEWCVRMGFSAYANTAGNGELDSAGNPDVGSWPTDSNIGAGCRGGALYSDTPDMGISDRRTINYYPTTRCDNNGWRCVRSAP